MMRFRYLTDPLFLFCLGLYAVNRWIFKPYLPCALVNDYVNDLICIPFWVPIQLRLMRRVGLRATDAPPQPHDILIPLIVWSLVFEVLLPGVPGLPRPFIADPGDIFAYLIGAIVAIAFWRWCYARR